MFYADRKVYRRKKQSRWNVEIWSIHSWGKCIARVLSLETHFPYFMARRTMGMMTNNNARVLDWPARSPDVNPIEHLWDVFKRKNMFSSGSTHGTRTASWRHSNVGEHSSKLYSEVHCVYKREMPGCYSSRERKYNVQIVEYRGIIVCDFRIYSEPFVFTFLTRKTSNYPMKF